MRLDFWRPVLRNTRLYLNELEAWAAEFVPWSIRQRHPFQPEPFPPGSLPEWDEPAMWDAAEDIIRRMAWRVGKTNAASWRAAARETWHARRIYEALRREIGSPLGMRVDEIVAADVRLLRRLPNLIAERAAAYVGAEQRRGVRAREIARGLETKLPVMSRSLVQMFARTSVGRAETAFTRARAERAGLPWYVWTTSEDGRVRLSHRKMANVLVAWADPPAPEQLVGEPSPLGHYAPGVAYNCRCLALPLVDAGEVRWPHRLYEHGSISLVSRSDFQRIAGTPLAA